MVKVFDEILFSVDAGEHDREFCPMKMELDVGRLGGVKLFWLAGGLEEAIPCQVEELGLGKISLAWIIDELGKGEKGRYKVVLGEIREPEIMPAGVELQDFAGERVGVKVGNELFTNYYYSQKLAKPYLYPLIGVGGESLTRGHKGVDEAVDHVHHRSVWVAHGDVNGNDFWSESGEHGKIVHQSFDELVSGPVYGKINALNHWVSRKGKLVLKERRIIKIYNLVGSARILDFDIILEAVEDLFFGDTKEAGILSVRVAELMEVVNGGRIENSYGGIDEGETWGKPAAWCDYSGPLRSGWAGIAVFDSPENLRYPTYWHVRDYGLMCANCFGISMFEGDPEKSGRYELAAGGELRFSYRVYLHGGDAQTGKVAVKYYDYINSPAVKLE